MQAPVVRQYDERAGAEEVLVPDAEQAHQHGQVAFERRGAEVFVHVMTARAASARMHRMPSASASDSPTADHSE